MDRKIDRKVLRAESWRRWLQIGGVVVLLVIAGWVASPLLEKKIDKRDFTLAEVECGALEIAVPATGRVVPGYEEIITSPVNSRILRGFVQAGDSVAKGTPLLELDLENEQSSYEKLVNDRRIRSQELERLRLANNTDLSELAMRIKVLEMQVSHSRLEMENERRLDSIGSGTGERVRQAETAYKAGELELRQLREKLQNERRRAEAAEEVQRLTVSSVSNDVALMERTLQQGRIPAPLSGVLTFILSDPGTRVSAGEKVAVVSDLSYFKISGEVSEGNLDKVAVGAKADVRIGSTIMEGTVSNLIPQSRSGVVSFVVSLKNPRHERLRSGLKVDMGIAYGYRDSVLRIPSGTYFKGAGDYSLFVADGNGALVRRKVTLGDSNRDFVEVRAGLKRGEKVVVSDMERYEKTKKLRIK